MFVIGVLLVFGAFQSPRGEGVVQTSSARTAALRWTEFQSPRGEGVVQTRRLSSRWSACGNKFQSPRGEGVVQTCVDGVRQHNE